MARSKNNVVTEGLSGMLARQIVFRQRAGQTIVGKAPVRSQKASQAQQLHQQRFARAAFYAKSALQNSALKQSYAEEAKKRPGTTSYNMAIADYLKAPVIDAVDTSNYTGSVTGEKIVVQVSDTFKVTGVKVKITDHDATLVEEGNATFQEGKWVYTTTVVNASLTGDKVIVTATDRPANVTTKEFIL
ncbi:hypothetical protein [Capnocytophaga sp. oral taxon 324]|uniref:hypothetical protein n=1 Tax=Capnocytophaga sp. oral taxon 324 TaxID=712211 RepID=UPI0002A24B36|nr:hypothetical protein [Capnocytophaga sp. oral taxon 324]EKY12120.1 hypothetical protein HMPREF9072_02168 [Capnocytophaga sp. oral taxon 324 str. F0483]